VDEAVAEVAVEDTTPGEEAAAIIMEAAVAAEVIPEMEVTVGTTTTTMIADATITTTEMVVETTITTIDAGAAGVAPEITTTTEITFIIIIVREDGIDYQWKSKETTANGNSTPHSRQHVKWKVYL
jgi:hypothetical protein